MLRRTLAAVAATLVLVPAANAQVARYHLDGAGSDSSGHGLHASPGGAPAGVADGRFGGAFRFGDPQDAFTVAASPLLQPAHVTVAVWVRAPVVPLEVKSVVTQGAQATHARSPRTRFTPAVGSTQPAIRFYVWNGTRTFVTPSRAEHDVGQRVAHGRRHV